MKYPKETARIMASQIYQLRRIVGYWFARRHTTHNSAGVRNWIAELRRVDRASGYSLAVRSANLPMVHYRSKA